MTIALCFWCWSFGVVVGAWWSASTERRLIDQADTVRKTRENLLQALGAIRRLQARLDEAGRRPERHRWN